MALGVGRSLTLPLLVLNFCLYLIAACLAGWALNHNIDHSVGSSYYVGNRATNFYLPLVLVACMVGLASCFAGIHHLRVWRSESLAGAGTAALIAWLLTLLALGLACKEIHIDHHRSIRLRVLEAFTIILAFTQLLYLLSLHAGLLFDRYGPPTSRGGTGTGTGSEFGEKHQHGTPAAAAGV
ncbi:unnamed protein product [Sphagnum troendelagicum]|uniref:Uncharacterized protein n=1 Tax=Sphagnum troendelagicum TaxID=128251 RepID=A0ABP0UD83_9BRYO